MITDREIDQMRVAAEVLAIKYYREYKKAKLGDRDAATKRSETSETEAKGLPEEKDIDKSIESELPVAPPGVLGTAG